MRIAGIQDLPLFNEPSVPSVPATATWLGFTADHSRDDAAHRFRQRYDQSPDQILEANGNIILVGPVPTMKG